MRQVNFSEIYITNLNSIFFYFLKLVPTFLSQNYVFVVEAYDLFPSQNNDWLHFY